MKVSDLGYDQIFLELVDGNDFDLYDHQVRAIEYFRKGKNVLVSVPTASGKTLIAYSAIYETYRKGLKSIYIVPLRSLAIEKYEEMSRLRELGMRVRLSIGNYDDAPDFIKYYDVIIMTSEKADSLLHHDPDMLQDIGLMVVDEIHLMGDESRGPTLETIITSSKIINPGTLIMALSATVSNATDLAKWLDASLVISDFRPVPLQVGILYKDSLYMDENRERIGSIIDLIKKTVQENGQVIVFVNSRKRSEDFASELSHVFEETSKISISSDDSNIYDEIINEIVQHGVAFHHAGLSNEQRSFIEKNFKNGSIKVIVATPTLAAGVNLPARMVIVKDITRYTSDGIVYLPNLEIRQMIGRAGRPKYDKYGIGVIYAASKNSFEVAQQYIQMDTEPIKSGLGSDRLIRFYVLAVITMRIGNNRDSIYEFFRRTFYYQQNGEDGLKEKIDSSLEFLIDNDFVKGDGNFSATPFGRYTSDLYIDPESALTLKRYFDQKHSTDLALYYISLCSEMLPFNYRGDAYGYEFLEDIGMPDGNVDAAKTACVLRDWINEVSTNGLYEKYGIAPGDIQSRVSSADWISYSLSRLSALFKPEIRRDLGILNIRIREGIKPEIMELTMIPGIGRVRARRLYSAGLKSIAEIAASDESRITRIYGFSHSLASSVIRRAKAIASQEVHSGQERIGPE